MREKVYSPSPTMLRFHADNSYGRILIGPINSGKSSACIIEINRRAMAQRPRGGVRATRWLIIRNSYPKLKSSTIESWKEWYPALDYHIPEGGSPIYVTVKRALADGTTVQMGLHFLSIDQYDPNQVGSMQYTGVWVNEARELVHSSWSQLTRVVGRYPTKSDGGPSWAGIMADSNPPDYDTWLYDLLEKSPPDWKGFRQPPALVRVGDKLVANEGQIPGIPAAENAENVPGGFDYWFKQCAGKDPAWIDNMILGQYGKVWTGRPVYEGSFNASIHVARYPLDVLAGQPLYLGWDFGGLPACCFGQVNPLSGQLIILAEAVTEPPGYGLQDLVESGVRPLLAGRFAGLPVYSVGDPSGAQRAQTNAVSPLADLARMGIPTEPAPTNAFNPRRDAVIEFLQRRTGDEEPGLLIDSRCKTLVAGMSGAYQFKKVGSADGLERYSLEPDKTQESHICEGLQYLCAFLKRGLVRNRSLGAVRPDNWPGLPES